MDVKEEATVGFRMKKTKIWKGIAHIGGMVDADILLSSADQENTNMLQSISKHCVSNIEKLEDKKEIKHKK
jgi:hypothetical protein